MIKIKYLVRLILFLVILLSNKGLLAADGDTVRIRTVEFGETSGKYLFPAKGESFQKVIINYKIKCPCAEWDYMAYVFANDLEIFRYITPYGNGLDVGSAGFNHQVDVTDFSEFLRDSVVIRNENSQEPVEITFDFIRGTPPRIIITFENLYRIEKAYNKDFEDNQPPLKRIFTEEEKFVRLKIIQSGHGWDNDDRCNEFCKKDGIVKVNGEERYRKTIWREDCGLNPIYPQGGTWLLNRSNWCPGSEVNYYDYELGEFITAGVESEIDYDMQYYDEPVTGDVPVWRTAVYLITYSAPNFQNDAEIYDVLYPTKKDMFKRMQPVCGNAAVVLRNSGAHTLTEAKFKITINQTDSFEYTWSGELKFLETDTVYIPLPENMNLQNLNNLFEAEIIGANGVEDQYAYNNKAVTYFDITPKYHQQFTINLLTNNYAAEQYVLTLKNADGEEIFRKENLSDNTKYEYPFDLPVGCYELRLVNKLNYGLDSWFMRAQLGTGSMSLFVRGNLVKAFGSDFGTEILHHFRVGPKPEIKTSADSIWFGKVLINTSVNRNVEIEPLTSEPLLVRELKILLGDMRRYYIESTDPEIPEGGLLLQPGEKLKVNIRFSPNKGGNFSTNLIIQTNDELNPQYAIKLAALAGEADGVESEIANNLILQAVPSILADRTEISFGLNGNEPMPARLTLADALGKTAAVLFEGIAHPYYNMIELNSANLENGMYFLILQSGTSVITKKIIVIK